MSSLNSLFETFALSKSSQKATSKCVSCAVRVDNLARVDFVDIERANSDISTCLGLCYNGGFRTLRDDDYTFSL